METIHGVAEWCENSQFKSYYVVWKPYEVTQASDGRYRLNRTMQYGNYSASDVLGEDLKRLNRTMQYGNAEG